MIQYAERGWVYEVLISAPKLYMQEEMKYIQKMSKTACTLKK